MKIAKSTKIWGISLLLLIATTQSLWWLFPTTWVETFYFGLGAFWFGKLWGDVTTYIEKR